MRIASRARNRDGVELCRLVRDLFVRAVGVKALGATTINLVVERAVRTKLVRPEKCDLRIVGMARALYRMRRDDAEAPAVREKIINLELLVPHGDNVALEPGLIDPAKCSVVHRLDVDPDDFRTDRPQTPNFHHRSSPLNQSSMRRNSGSPQTT